MYHFFHIGLIGGQYLILADVVEEYRWPDTVFTNKVSILARNPFSIDLYFFSPRWAISYKTYTPRSHAGLSVMDSILECAVFSILVIPPIARYYAQQLCMIHPSLHG